MRSGRLRHSVQLQSPAGSRNAVGERTTTWSTVQTVWAGIEPLRANEVIAAAQSQMNITHRIVMRYDSSIAGITHGWRILFGSRVFDIQGVRNIDEKNRVYELLCSEGLRD